MKWKEIPKEDVPKHDTIQIATFHYAQEDVPVFLIPDESLSTETGQQAMTVDKEAVLKKLFKKLPDSIELVGNEDEISAVRIVIYQAMDEYLKQGAASLLKENEELKKDLTSYKESFENNKEQFMELAAHAKDLEIEIAELKDRLKKLPQRVIEGL